MSGCGHAHIHVTGVVQGVGMRPFVYRLALAHGVSGWVLNAGDGVHIEAHAEPRALDDFAAALRRQAPAAARVESVLVTALEPGSWNAADEQGFRIAESAGSAERTTLVSPDIATCDDCLRELFDPADRRYHYPFINCTNCGPRFTIMRSLPYDRAATSMDAFPMCPACAREYADPADRRFHAQPDACFACGPHLTWREAGQGAGTVGNTLETSDAIVGRCAWLLANGGIVAIKGLGGFHLACNAADNEAVRELRRRKRRSNKPLAVMVRTLADAQALCHVGPTEESLLAGTVRPIVLMRRRIDAAVLALAPSVAYDLPELGVMLPYTPLQHLLLQACANHGLRALVMTSGNISEEPIEVDDGQAWEKLVGTGIADALLGNDRAILSRFDDSVVRVVDGATMPVRRARGYAPQPLDLPTTDLPVPNVLACGPEQKSTIALTRERDDGTAACFVSQHIGDVENGATLTAWNGTRERFKTLFDLQPQALACDLHPAYLPSSWARQKARETNTPLIEVQHHHAHIASVVAEAIVGGTLAPCERVVGIAYDGTGAGTDGTVWGGEFLVANLESFERAAHLRTWRLPGGAASVRDAKRNAFALLTELDLLEHPGAAALLDRLDEQTRAITATMIDRDINSPRTSSMGRLFDAVAALLGICDTATYDGEPAIALEAAAWKAFSSKTSGQCAKRGKNEPLEAPEAAKTIIPEGKTSPNKAVGANSGSSGEDEGFIFPTFCTESGEIDTRPIVNDLLDGMAAGNSPETLALSFHEAVTALTVRVANAIRENTGISTVALSGGVFMNRLLLAMVCQELKAAGFKVLVPQTMPVNDGCIAYGQAAVARAQLANQH